MSSKPSLRQLWLLFLSYFSFASFLYDFSPVSKKHYFHDYLYTLKSYPLSHVCV